LTKERKFITVFIALDLSVGVFPGRNRNHVFILINVKMKNKKIVKSKNKRKIVKTDDNIKLKNNNNNYTVFNGLTKERKFITVFIALDLSVGVFPGRYCRRLALK
jgi:hypothetical protein